MILEDYYNVSIGYAVLLQLHPDYETFVEHIVPDFRKEIRAIFEDRRAEVRALKKKRKVEDVAS